MKPLKGIRRTPHGWRCFLRVKGRPYFKRFKKRDFDTEAQAIREMQLWLKETELRALGRIAPQPDGDGSTFAQDVRTYLAARADMPTIDWRDADMQRWTSALGAHRQTRTITSVEIRTVLAKWKREGYAENTLNHRRSALSNFFAVLGLPNPVKDVPRYRDTSKDAPPKALSLEAVAALLEQMPDSATKARLELMLWTGWPHKQIRALQPSDIDKANQVVWVGPRAKGKGVAGAWMPLLPPAWTALKHFAEWDCWGPSPADPKRKAFSPSSMRKSLRLAADKVRAPLDPDAAVLTYRYSESVRAEVADITPYDFRHTFGTLAAALTQDDRAVQELMRHSDIRQTRRYTEKATNPRVVAALARMVAALGLKPDEV